MATFFTDFSEYTAGSPPSDWTARGTTTSSTWTAETGGDDKVLKHTLGASAQRWVSWDDLDGDANRDNVEVLGLIYNNGLVSTSNGGGLWVRGSDSSGIYAYNCAIRSDKLRLAKYISGTATVLSDFAGTFSAATWYWVRFRVNGTSIKARIWADGGSEPGTWDIDTTNGDVTGVGWAGASNGNASADPSFELFGVGTNGDTAPSSASSGTDIAAALESLSLSTFGATVGSARDIAGALESLTLTANAATVSSDRAIAGQIESISLTANAATVSLDAAIAAALESITVTGFTASVSTGAVISAQLESITVAANPAAIASNRDIAAALEALGLTTYPATVALGTLVAAGLEQIALSAYPAGITLDVTVAGGLEQITLTALAAQVGLGSAISAALESITLTEFGATITMDASIAAAMENIGLSTFSATIGSSEAALTTPGLEFTIPLGRMHYSIPIGRIHFTIPRD